MRKFYFLVLAFLFAGILHAQVALRKKACYTATYLQQLQQNNPNVQTTADFEKWMAAKIGQKRSTPVLNSITDYGPLPIVFHILNVGETEGTGYNIAQSLVIAQVMQLNKDYANLSASPYSVSSKTGLQFCLAQKDPSGNTLAEPGIDRINTSLQSFGQPPYLVDSFEINVKPATIWDPNRYVNVWVTEFDPTQGILGYSTFPAASTLPGLNDGETNQSAGVAVDYNTVGSIGTPSGVCDPSNTYTNGRTLTHELGHYFGLRHIWGDALCGDDYCDDTPVQASANFGAPQHPKPNSCGTPDEMFENYMDYTDDRVMNTFTLNQSERMQVVMVNSPRRTTLTTSNAGCSSINSTNKIGFFPCNGALTVPEKSSLTTCPKYTDVNLLLNIEDKASGTATLNFVTGGTATQGADYDILTPTINIAAGDPFKQVTIRVYDDAAKEADETITVSYTITGTGVTPNTNLPQTFTLTIADDDRITVGQNAKTIYTQDFGTTGNAWPSGWAALTVPSFPTPKNKFLVGSQVSAFTGQSLYVSNNTSTRVNAYTITTASASIAQSGAIDPGGAASMSLSFKYRVAGERDSLGIYDFGLVQTSPESNPNAFTTIPGTPVMVGPYDPTTGGVKLASGTITTPLPANLTGNKFRINFLWANDNNTGTQPPLAIDDILITGTPTPVESDSGHSQIINTNAVDSNFIRSNNDGQIIAAISNAGESYKCLSASIQQAGIGQVNISTEAGSYKRTAKVIKLTPSATTSSTYTITLYYTTAELAAWPSITNLKVMKVQDGVSLGSVLNAVNSVILTPVVADYRSSDGYASFTVTASGFSQFFLVSSNTILPVQIISFNAAAVNNGASLIWNTANETTNKGFNVQRSLDGLNFSTIGFVAGKNSDANSNYSFFDSSIRQGITYFYRLQQVDENGRITVSAVRTVMLNSESMKIMAYPNPAHTFTHVVTGKNMIASVRLLSANGQKVWSMEKQSITTGGFDVPMQNLAKGIYMLWIQDDKSSQNIKIVKE